MTILPFGEFVSKGIKRNDVIPLEPARSPRSSFGNVAGIVNNISSLGILGATIKGGLVAAVNFLYQDFLGLAKGLHCAVALASGIDRFGRETDHRQYQRKGRSYFGISFD